ncbi:hypothetical protein BaRGS_00034844 [Batillaria attramentaria]|uniref:Uncharacterized protein n=1 Tax=Batillaria attramentaria TaxID=370345 RepID=A0ABD0JGK9_9CAEN
MRAGEQSIEPERALCISLIESDRERSATHAPQQTLKADGIHLANRFFVSDKTFPPSCDFFLEQACKTKPRQLHLRGCPSLPRPCNPLPQFARSFILSEEV